MRKIVIRMRGGLGNQLFILAFAYKIAEIIKEDYEIVLDTREYKTYKVRNFEILGMLQDEKVRIFDEQDNALGYDITREMYHVAQLMIPDYSKIPAVLAKMGFYYSKRSAEGALSTNRDTVYAYGYFQDVNMVDSIKPVLLEKLILPQQSKFCFEEGVRYVAVSVRCGQDYVDQGWPVCGKEYYIKGVREILEEKYADKKVKVLIFSDEIEKTKEMHICDGATYITSCSPIEQLAIMSKCDDFVISNSSFSWWGAYLGAKPESVVIAPDLWYPDKKPTTDTLLIYKNIIVRDMFYEKN